MSVVSEERCARDSKNARDKLKQGALPRFVPRFLVSVVVVLLGRVDIDV